MQKIITLFVISLTAAAASDHHQTMVQGQMLKEVKASPTDAKSGAETGHRRLTEKHSHHQRMVQGKTVEEHKAHGTANASSGGRRRLTEEQDGSAYAGSGVEAEAGHRRMPSTNHQKMVQGKMVEVEKAKTNVESGAEAGGRRLIEHHSHHQTMVQGQAVKEHAPRRGLTPRAKF